jgi:site-specific DNA-methyltransferase (adenine-specific)
MEEVKLYNGDARQLFSLIDDETIDCIVTDPPYEVISGGAQENDQVQRPSGILSKNDGKIFENNDIDISTWIGECYRVLKQDTHIYIMTNFLNLRHYMDEIIKAGFEIHNLLIWKKNNATPNRWYMKNCEYIIFARKGAAKPINDCGCKTVIEVNNVKNRTHPTEKPVDLLRILISNSTNVGEVVLDPFGGTMSTAFAALSCGRKAISFEIDKNYFDIGEQRIANFNSGDISLIEKKINPLTQNQEIILKILKENPDRDFSGKELSELSGLSVRTCSGCITPLCSAKKAKKTNSKSPFRIQFLKEEA